MSAPTDDGESTGGSVDPPDAAGASVGDDASQDVDRLRSRISELETELERKDAELETVRRQYEAILQARSADTERW